MIHTTDIYTFNFRIQLYLVMSRQCHLVAEAFPVAIYSDRAMRHYDLLQLSIDLCDYDICM